MSTTNYFAHFKHVGSLPLEGTAQRVPAAILLVITLAVAYVATTVAYNGFFHPLSKFPGPKLAGMSFLPWAYRRFSGTMVPWLKEMHEREGDIVRYAPDMLSFANAQAWKDIYGHRTGGKKSNPKLERFYQPGPNDVQDMVGEQSDKRHSEVRKIFSNAFSDKALKLQEPTIAKYVDQLIVRMRRTVQEKPNQAVNILKLYNFTTFDIMGDLTFGEPLGMLENGEYTSWVSGIFAGLKMGDILNTIEVLTIPGLIHMLLPSLNSKEREHFQHSYDRVDKRLKTGREGHPDIWDLVLKKQGANNALSLGEMHANSSLFMLAGTETTATLLSGLTYLLLANPESMKKVTEEVRVLAPEDLNLENLPRLPYLNSCFEEALRCYPPVPEGLPRQVPDGGNIILDQLIPAKTVVSVPQKVINMNGEYWRNPTEFIPERWLPGTGFDNDRRDAMQPFSYGPRNCLGKNLAYHEMRIIFAKVIYNFDLELDESSSNWIKQYSWILWEKPDLMVKFKPVRSE